MGEGCDCLLYSDEEVVLFTSLYEQVFAIDEIVGSDFLVEGSKLFFVETYATPLGEFAHFALRGKALGGFCHEVYGLDAESLVAAYFEVGHAVEYA